MTTMTTEGAAPCPHCGAINPAGAAFCESCGKALPAAAPTAPRVVTGDTLAYSSAGLTLQADELHKQAKKAATALAVVAVLTTLGAIIFAAILYNTPPERLEELIITPLDVGVNIAVAAIFWVLFVWARKNPLPPAIVGLVLYITLTVVQFIMLAIMIREAREAADLAPGESLPGGSSAMPGMGGIWIRIFIIIMFVQAIQAGVKHRKLKRQIEASGVGGAATV